MLAMLRLSMACGGSRRSHKNADLNRSVNHVSYSCITSGLMFSISLLSGMVPMFPHALAEGPFSLRANGEPSPAMSLGITLSADGGIADYTVTPSLVAPAQRLTYHEVDALLQGGGGSGTGEVVAALQALAQVQSSTPYL